MVFTSTFQGPSEKTASKFKPERESSVPLGGALMTLTQVLLDKVQIFFSGVVSPINFLSLKMDTHKCPTGTLESQSRINFLFIPSFFLQRVGCLDLISLGKQGLPWKGLLFQGGARSCCKGVWESWIPVPVFNVNISYAKHCGI